MNLETAVHVWSMEAIAHGYIGFLVVEDPNFGIDRAFIASEEDIGIVRESVANSDSILIQEVLLDARTKE